MKIVKIFSIMPFSLVKVVKDYLVLSKMLSILANISSFVPELSITKSATDNNLFKSCVPEEYSALSCFLNSPSVILSPSLLRPFFTLSYLTSTGALTATNIKFFPNLLLKTFTSAKFLGPETTVSPAIFPKAISAG